MKMRIEDIIKISGDSYLENYSYSNGTANIILLLGELEKRVLIKIKTSLVALSISVGNDEVYRTCFIELISLSEVLKSKNGIYIPSENFEKFMTEKRENLNLAYGLRIKEMQFIFSFSAGYKLASFIIRDIEDICIEYVE